MRTHVEIGGSSTLQPEKAVIVYRGGSHAYATVHDVKLPGRNGRPRLGTGKPVTTSFVRALARELGNKIPLEVLPPQVVCRTEDVVAWWSPAGPRPMFFREGSELGRLDARVMEQPALLWAVSGRGLYVRALRESNRPDADTPLFHAPYWNVYLDGHVCLGSMRRPEHTTMEVLREWEDGFFGSQFTHEAGGGRRIDYKGGVVGLWKAMARRKTFPINLLIPTKQTLAQFLGGIHA